MPQTATDRPDRGAVLERAEELAWQLAGELVLLPITPDGHLDVEALEANGCDEFDYCNAAFDPDRLGVLIDGFTDIIEGCPLDLSIVVLDAGGTPQFAQFHGKPFPAAVALVQAAVHEGRKLERNLPKRTDNEFEGAWRAFHRQLAPPLPRNPVPANDNALPLVVPSTWQGRDVPERAWWLEGLIPARTVTLLTGDGGLGKSLLALQLAVASALDAPTADLTPAAGRVLYVGAEDEVDEFHRRLADILATHHCEFADLGDRLRLVPLADRDATLMMPDQKGRMVVTPLLEQLTLAIDSYSPGLVVLDTSADLFGGDEIKRAHVRAFVAALRQIALTCDCAVLLLSHPSVAGMATGTGTSGSTAWNNSVRSRLYLSRPKGDDVDPDLRELTVMKANYGAAGEAVRLRWQEGVFVRDDPQATTMASGFVHKRHDAKFIEMLTSINRTGQRVAPTKGVNYAPSVMAARPDGALSKKQFESAMQRLFVASDIRVVMDGPRSKLRQKLVVTDQYFGPDRRDAG